MMDECDTQATFQGVTYDGSVPEFSVNFFIVTVRCEHSSGRLNYTYTEVLEGGASNDRNRNSTAWTAADGNRFFLRDKIPGVGIAAVTNVRDVSVGCECAD